MTYQYQAQISPEHASSRTPQPYGSLQLLLLLIFFDISLSPINSKSSKIAILSLLIGIKVLKSGEAQIAAPQIGELKRISVIEFDGVRHVLINPEITSKSNEKMLIREGCLSFFNVRGNVERFESVTVRAQDLDGVFF
ncbi:MAG: peptide deformylase [Bdellovibrionota bacterium]